MDERSVRKEEHNTEDTKILRDLMATLGDKLWKEKERKRIEEDIKENQELLDSLKQDLRNNASNLDPQIKERMLFHKSKLEKKIADLNEEKKIANLDDKLWKEKERKRIEEDIKENQELLDLLKQDLRNNASNLNSQTKERMLFHKSKLEEKIANLNEEKKITNLDDKLWKEKKRKRIEEIKKAKEKELSLLDSTLKGQQLEINEIEEDIEEVSTEIQLSEFYLQNLNQDQEKILNVDIEKLQTKLEELQIKQELLLSSKIADEKETLINEIRGFDSEIKSVNHAYNGFQSYRKGDLSEAIKYFEKVAKLNPKKSSRYYKICLDLASRNSRDLFNTKKYNEAIESLIEAESFVDEIQLLLEKKYKNKKVVEPSMIAEKEQRMADIEQDRDIINENYTNCYIEIGLNYIEIGLKTEQCDIANMISDFKTAEYYYDRIKNPSEEVATNMQKYCTAILNPSPWLVVSHEYNKQLTCALNNLLPKKGLRSIGDFLLGCFTGLKKTKAPGDQSRLKKAKLCYKKVIQLQSNVSHVKQTLLRTKKKLGEIKKKNLEGKSGSKEIKEGSEISQGHKEQYHKRNTSSLSSFDIG